MIVRELVTLLSFKKGNEAPLHEYGHALRHVARLAAEFFAIGAAVEMARKVTELSDEWATVAGRISNVVEGLQEQHRVLDALQLQSEKTGQSYESIGSLFAMLKMTGSSLGYTTDQILGLSGAISQLVTLGGGTEAGAKRGMIQIEEMFSLGVVQTQHLKALMIDIPGAVDVLSASLKGGKKEFMDMVAAGTMTSKVFGDLFIKSADEIERRFGKMPLTFARAFTTVRNYFGRLIADIGEGSDAFTTLAQAIVDSGKGIVDAFRWFERVTGSWTNALKAAGIALVALVGPTALRMVMAMVRAMRALTLASIGVAAPWYLLVALIALAGLAVEDLWRWFNGKSSLTERMIGPYSEWKGTIDAWKSTIITALEVVGIALAALFIAGPISRFTLLVGALAYSFSTTLVGAIQAASAALVAFNAAGMALPIFRAITTAMSVYDMATKKGAVITPENTAPGSRDFQFLTPDQQEESRRKNPEGGTSYPLEKLKEGWDWLKGAIPRGGVADPASFVPPAAMAPPGPVTTNNAVSAPISVTVNSASDTPQAVGAAAGEGARKGTLEGWARTLGMAAPQTEFGLAY